MSRHTQISNELDYLILHRYIVFTLETVSSSIRRRLYEYMCS